MCYYQVEFEDGQIIRREYVAQKIAQAMFIAMEQEMILFKVKSVTWGKM